MRTISQSELRNRYGEILRQIESGKQLTVTVKGRPVAVLVSCQQRQWVPREEFLRILRTLPPDPTLLEDVRESS